MRESGEAESRVRARKEILQEEELRREEERLGKYREGEEERLGE